MRLTCEKQKDGAEFEPWAFELAPTGESVRIEHRTAHQGLTPSEEQVLEAVRAEFRMDWFRSRDMRAATQLSKTTTAGALKSLTQRGQLSVRSVGKQQMEYRLAADADEPSATVRELSDRTGPEPSVRVPLPLEGDGAGKDTADETAEAVGDG
jgi:hypothetical protein